LANTSSSKRLVTICVALPKEAKVRAATNVVVGILGIILSILASKLCHSGGVPVTHQTSNRKYMKNDPVFAPLQDKLKKLCWEAAIA
jgi:hypothetical protein